MKRLLLAVVTLLFALSASANQQIEEFAAHMQVAHGFDKEPLQTLLEGIQPDEKVQLAFSKPLTDLPWRRFEHAFISEERIDKGVKFWNENYDALVKAEKTYHVPAAVIVSILGIETNYGRTIGHFRVLDTLVTLSFYSPRRTQFFQKELEQFLLIAREQNWNYDQVVGSYAGAIGIPQFMPSSLRAFAVDFNDDNQIDLVSDSADAVGSVGNYLNKNGWKPKVPNAKNFKVVLRYNSNHNYANAVLLLAKRIEQRRDARFYELIK